MRHLYQSDQSSSVGSGLRLAPTALPSLGGFLIRGCLLGVRVVARPSGGLQATYIIAHFGCLVTVRAGSRLLHTETMI